MLLATDEIDDGSLKASPAAWDDGVGHHSPGGSCPGDWVTTGGRQGTGRVFGSWPGQLPGAANNGLRSSRPTRSERTAV